MFLFRNKVAPTDEDENIDYEDGDQYGCWGRGTCNVETDKITLAEKMVCECQNNLDPGTHCKECIENYYPSPFLDTSTIESCSVECTTKTCNEAAQNTIHNGYQTILNAKDNNNPNARQRNPQRLSYKHHCFHINNFHKTCRQKYLNRNNHNDH